MTKLEFLDVLYDKLSGLPEKEIEERLTFYSEMIDDSVDEGLSEEEAVARIGAVEDITVDIPDAKAEQAKRKLSPWAIVLLILGAPLWISLLAGAFSVVISLYAALLSVVVSLWAAEVALWGSALGGLAGGSIMICTGNAAAGIALVGISLVCAGLSLIMFYGCTGATKGAGWLTKKTAAGIRNRIFKKEDVR